MEGIKEEFDSSCCILCNNKELIRAVKNNNLGFLKKLLEKPSRFSSILSF